MEGDKDMDMDKKDKIVHFGDQGHDSSKDKQD